MKCTKWKPVQTKHKCKENMDNFPFNTWVVSSLIYTIEALLRFPSNVMAGIYYFSWRLHPPTNLLISTSCLFKCNYLSFSTFYFWSHRNHTFRHSTYSFHCGVLSRDHICLTNPSSFHIPFPILFRVCKITG